MQRLALQFGLLITVLALGACNLAGLPASNPNDPENIDLPETNLVLNQQATASTSLPDKAPQNAFDGSISTQWEAGAHPEQWIQVDLGEMATITRIRLTVAQYPDGQTRHEVLFGRLLVELQPVHEFSGQTVEGQALEYRFDSPIPNIRYVRIDTKESPSWVAWKEIEVYGYVSSEPGQAVVTEGMTETANDSRAEVIYHNAQILTMEGKQPTAQAIALKGAMILAVGSNEDVMRLKGDSTKMVDLNGLTVTPGFINSHSHRIGDKGMSTGESLVPEEIMQNILKEGWTSTHELFVWDERMNELIVLDRAGLMPIRVSAYLAVGFDYDYNPWYQGTGYKPLQQFSPHLQIGGIKITLDREWGEQVFFNQEQLDQMVLDATQAGWQIATHSFSPQANEAILNSYEKALDGQSNETLRLRIEHTGVMTDEQVEKMADLGIIGSMQLIGTAVWADDVTFKKYIPQEMWPKMARWRDLINAGVLLIGNTDDPWCCTAWRKGSNDSYGDPTAMQAIYQGVTRIYFTGRQPEPWQVSQAVTVEEALSMLTINGAYAAHQEEVIGSLKPGKFADIVILSGNPLTTPIGEIPRIEVYMTMVGGESQYCAPGQEAICVSAGP